MSAYFTFFPRIMQLSSVLMLLAILESTFLCHPTPLCENHKIESKSPEIFFTYFVLFLPIFNCTSPFLHTCVDIAVFKQSSLSMRNIVMWVDECWVPIDFIVAHRKLNKKWPSDIVQIWFLFISFCVPSSSINSLHTKKVMIDVSFFVLIENSSCSHSGLFYRDDYIWPCFGHHQARTARRRDE